MQDAEINNLQMLYNVHLIEETNQNVNFSKYLILFFPQRAKKALNKRFLYKCYSILQNGDLLSEIVNVIFVEKYDCFRR